jgi:TPR repeat protein
MEYKVKTLNDITKIIQEDKILSYNEISFDENFDYDEMTGFLLKNQNDVRYICFLGFCFLKIANVEKGISQYQKAAKLKYSRAQCELGMCYF